MKTLKIAVLTLFPALGLFAQQNTLVATTLTAATVSGQTCFAVAATTGMNAPAFNVAASQLFIVDVGGKMGDLRQITSISGLNVCARVATGSARAHASGAIVLVGTIPDYFTTVDPTGACVAANTLVTPLVNTANGNQWLCSTVTLTWVPGWGNAQAPQNVTAAVASVAGSTALSGPFFHMTGTNAVTGFTLPVGFTGGCVTIVADAIWTWTAAGNILTAGTTTAAGRYNRFCYDSSAGKWVPDKII